MEENKLQNDRPKEEIPLSEILHILWINKVKLIAICLIFSFLSVSFSFTITPEYKSSTLLILVDNDPSSNGMSGLSSQYGGLASMAGISLPGSSSTNRADFAVETVKSRDFFNKLYQIENILAPIHAAKGYDKKNKSIIYNEKIYDPYKQKWINSVPSKERAFVSYKDSLRVSKDKMTGFISMSYQHKSPKFTKEILNIIIDTLNQSIKEQDLKLSEDALGYLSSQLEINNKSDIRKSINNLIQSEIQKQMLMSITKDYILASIESPHEPLSRSSPSRKLFLLLGFILGFVLSVSYVLTRHYFNNK